jgi:hypothetical protein
MRHPMMAELLLKSADLHDQAADLLEWCASLADQFQARPRR